MHASHSDLTLHPGPHTHPHTHMHIFTHVRTHACMHDCTQPHTHFSTCACTCPYSCTCSMQAHTRAHAPMCSSSSPFTYPYMQHMQVYVHTAHLCTAQSTHKHTCMQQMHTYTHAQTHSCRCTDDRPIFQVRHTPRWGSGVGLTPFWGWVGRPPP